MNEVLITDLVSQQALDQLDALDRKMEGTLGQFKDCAMELAKGLKIPVEVTGDLDKLKDLANATMQRAGQAAQQYTQALQQQQQVIANTTNTISRQLAEQEKLNKAQREAFTQDQRAVDVAREILGTYNQNAVQLAEYTEALRRNKEQQKELDKNRKAGLISEHDYLRVSAALLAEQNKLKTAHQEVASVLRIQAKEANAAEGSYAKLSQQLELMKKAQKNLNESEKSGEQGRLLETEIQKLDARLKDLAADMGEFQRNVGNYAIANKGLKTSLREMQDEIANLMLSYDGMTDAEQKSAAGRELQEKIRTLTEEAGKYKDAVMDARESIKGSASDTRALDTLTESGKLLASTMGLASSAAQMFGLSNDSLAQSMLKVQQAMQAVQALTVIQNTLQKQSNIMKGVGKVQSLALAAAERIEAQAATQATGATVAQTAAMKVFNAVAKANPYVLLATAILTVIGLIIGYTAATKEATKADEAAKKAAEERKASQESMASSFGNTAGEMIAKYKLMREQWNALAGDVKAKQQYLKEHKSDFDNLAQAVDGAKSKMKGIDDVENIFTKSTPQVEAAIKRRAKAMAAYAEYIRLAQKKLEELENISTFKYRNFHAGDAVSTKELDAAGVDYSAGLNPFKQNLVVEIDEEQAKKLTEWSRRTNMEDNRKAREEIDKRYNEMMESAFNIAKENGAFEAASFRGGDYGTTGSKGGGSKGGSNKSTGKDQVKDYKALRDEIDKILLESYKKEEDFTQDWYEVQTAAINKQAEVEQRANAERAKKMEEELKKSLNAGKITQEQYDAELIQLRNATVEIDKNIEAKKVADLEALDEKMKKHREKEAAEEVDIIAKAYAAEQALADAAYQEKIARMYEEYTEAIRLANERGEDIAKINESFNRRKEAADNEYANDTVERSIEMMQLELLVPKLAEDEREKLQQELTKTTAELAQQRAEQEKKHIEDVVEADKTAKEKRQQNLQDWVQKAGEAFQKIGDFMTSMYDNQIAKIEELLEAEQERYDQQVEQIEYLAERGAITSEEAEIRKREAATATEKKQEELEKRKSQLEYKKAVMEKLNSIAQIGIATALGIMQTFATLGWPAGIPGAAFIAAMGAIQTATALAQPIKAYKEGTRGKPHPGGLALVGEGGSQELVMYNGKAWVTPDEPTLIDLPRGAEVFPDATAKDLLSLGASLPMAVPRDRRTGQPVIINDYSALESRMAANTKAVTKALREHQVALTRQLKRQKFNAYIASRI